MTNRVSLRLRKMLAASLGLLSAVVAPFGSGRQAFAQVVAPVAPAEAAGAHPLPPAQQAWSGYFSENPKLLEKLGVQPLHAPALSRLLAETALRPDNLKAIPLGLFEGRAGKQARMIRAEVGVLAQKAIEDAGRAVAPGAAQEPDGLRGRLRDFYAALPAVPKQQRAAVAAGSFLIEVEAKRKEAIRPWAERTREKTRRLVEGAAESWENNGDDQWAAAVQLAKEFELERRLSTSEHYKRDKKKADQKPEWSPLLVEHQGVIAAMEHGEPGNAVAHVLGLVQRHKAENVDGWFDLLQKLEGDASSNWNQLTFGLAKEMSSKFMSLNEGQRKLWSGHYWGISDYALNRPALEHLEVLAFRYALRTEGAGELWSDMRRFFETGLKVSKSKDQLRTALRLVSLRLKGAVPDAFWGKMLQSPPGNHEEREALGAIAVALGQEFTKMETRELLVHPQITMPARLDYARVLRGLLHSLQQALVKTIKLSAEDAQRLAEHPVLSDAAQPGGLRQNLLLYSSFASRWGRSSLKRLLSELLQSPIENGRIRHEKRYEKLKGKVPWLILKRWTWEYEKSVPDDGSEPAASPAAPSIDWAQRLQRLKAHLGISSSGELDALAPRVQALAARLRQEPAFAASSSWVEVLQNDFLPGVKTILDDLASSRAPPAELLKKLLPILAKAQIMKEVLAEPQAALKDFKELLAAAAPPENAQRTKAKAAESLVLHVTDDPAAMLRIGNVPKLTCQRCTEPTDLNESGEPLSRLLLGQFKLANWTMGGEIVGRSVVELGTDRWGAPALLVEPLYGANLPVERLKKSILDYARRLGVAVVFFSGEYRTEGEHWNTIGPRERFKAYGKGWLNLYRDTYVGLLGNQTFVILDPASKPGELKSILGFLNDVMIVLFGLFFWISGTVVGFWWAGLLGAIAYYVGLLLFCL